MPDSNKNGKSITINYLHLITWKHPMNPEAFNYKMYFFELESKHNAYETEYKVLEIYRKQAQRI
jgi:hypothetical protein